MPLSYDRSLGAYRVSCSRCGVYCLTHSSPHDGSETGTDGRMISDRFRWQSNNGAFVSRCRECERAVRQARRAAGPRVPGTTGSWARGAGEARRFGVELELIFPAGQDRYTIQAALDQVATGWRVKSDVSLSAHATYRNGHGWEVVSPILQGESGYEAIRVVTAKLKDLGAKPNRSCGLHVHHEVRELTVDQLKSVAKAWIANQPLLDGLVAPSRRGFPTYCSRYDSREAAMLDRCRTLEDMKRVGTSKYRTLNFKSYGRLGTLEVRQHQGTCDGEKVVTWVKFMQGLLTAATTQETAPAVRETHSRVSEFLGAIGAALDPTAKTFLLGRAVEFGHATV